MNWPCAISQTHVQFGVHACRVSDMTDTETEAGAETRQDMTRQGKTSQDDFAAYADAAARCCINILGLRSINQATQMTEERMENTQTVREIRRHASEQLFMSTQSVTQSSTQSNTQSST